MDLANLTEHIRHARTTGNTEDEILHQLLLHLAGIMEIIIPEDLLQTETNYILEERSYHLRYGRLMGLAQSYTSEEDILSEDSCRQEAKENLQKKLVLDSIIKEAGWIITEEETEREIAAIAARQNTSEDFVRGFLGPDSTSLKEDILYQKAENLILGLYQESLTT